jgi:hypothetical protein
MKHTNIIVAVVILLAISAGAGGLFARDHALLAIIPGSKHALAPVPTMATSAVGLPTVTPAIIAVNTPTTVTITVQITDPTVLPNGVNLLRLGATGTQPKILGVMNNDGMNGDAVANDTVYSLQVSFKEPTTGQIQLQVSAAFRGQLKRILTGVATIQVWSPIKTSLPLKADLPPKWIAIDDSDKHTNLYSDESLQSIAGGDTETPPDITISVLPNPTGLPTEQFVEAYRAGWFTHYAQVTNIAIANINSVEASDSNALIPHTPSLAVFVPVGSDIYVITSLEADSDEFMGLLATVQFTR